ncbi:HVO_0476 family zinc finger protein [Methanobacterium sp. CWC-01]|uniref:HVO_0476 family zinc finger protein n=1 Tax=Methanobacterium aridiramus TaxID=2584467 RepID=UPI002574D132|nr:HVO_0476 family zinc finger protein [Methanobacterium sp. CWC-01]
MMKCPVCGSQEHQILKSKGKLTQELLLKCEECGTVFRETKEAPRPLEIRIIISKFEESLKKWATFYPDEILRVDDVLEVGDERVRVTSLENKRSARVMESIVEDLITIWAASVDIPARVGVSVDLHGRVLSRKVEVDRDFTFTVGDVVKMGRTIFRIKTIKTLERRMRRGFAYADVTKRVYGIPVSERRYDYDLTMNVVT